MQVFGVSNDDYLEFNGLNKGDSPICFTTQIIILSAKTVEYTIQIIMILAYASRHRENMASSKV